MFPERPLNARLLKPHQIASETIELIDRSNRHAILVSPYVKLWGMLEQTLERAKNRGTRLTFFLRAEAKVGDLANGLHRKYGAEVVTLKDLHAKLFVGDTRAIVSSMNLYDASQSKNFELAMMFEQKPDVDRIRRECVDEGLRQLTPIARFEGAFKADVAAEQARLAELERQFESLGHCVMCGIRVELERKVKPYRVRCTNCYSRDPDMDQYREHTKRCFLCGKPHGGVLTEPYHLECARVMKEYLALKG